MSAEEIFAGDAAIIECTIADPDGDLLDLAGCAIEFVLAPDMSAVPAIAKTVGDGVTVTGLLTFDVTLTGADTEGRRGQFAMAARITKAGKPVTVQFADIRFKSAPF